MHKSHGWCANNLILHPLGYIHITHRNWLKTAVRIRLWEIKILALIYSSVRNSTPQNQSVTAQSLVST